MHTWCKTSTYKQTSLLGLSLRRQRRGVGAKGAVLARSFELVLEGSRVSHGVLFGAGSSSTCCEAPLARIHDDGE